MSEQNVEQSDGALPVQDIEGVHADPADLPDQVELAGETSDVRGGADTSGDVSTDDRHRDSYRQ
jgi:hypothetical protein